MKISQKKKDKICEQILALLYQHFPRALFTHKIALEIARDEEFVKSLLLNLKKSNMVVLINKNSKGKTYKKRQRWRLSNKAYEVYKQHSFPV